MTLHLIQKSPFTTSVFNDCLNMINPGDIILLMQDGVLGCQLPNLGNIKNRVLALQDDLDARGIQTNNQHVETINYQEFVNICTQCKSTISWY